MPSRDIDMARLPMWVIYDRPTDYPDRAVARLWYSMPQPTPTNGISFGIDVEVLRVRFRARGYTCLPRSPGDDAKIVESWML